MTEDIRWLAAPYRLANGSTLAPGWVDRSVYPEIPDSAFDNPESSLFQILRDDIRRSKAALEALAEPE